MRVTSRGQLTLPAEVREHLGLDAGSEVEFELDGDTVRIYKANDPARPQTPRRRTRRLHDEPTVEMSAAEIRALVKLGE